MTMRRLSVILGTLGAICVGVGMSTLARGQQAQDGPRCWFGPTGVALQPVCTLVCYPGPIDAGCGAYYSDLTSQMAAGTCYPMPGGSGCSMTGVFCTTRPFKNYAVCGTPNTDCSTVTRIIQGCPGTAPLPK